LLNALGLPAALFPPVHPSGERLGGLTTAMAEATGLPSGLPIFGAIGDNQASFLGSVADRGDTVLVNVGTGGQVAAYCEGFLYDPRLETRPFPRGGFLLVCPGLVGGRTYATLQSFFQRVGTELLGTPDGEVLYATMNRLAASAPAGAGGVRCEPYFTGTRENPDLRGSWTGLAPESFTPANLTRALLEGMARAFHSGFEAIRRHLHRAPSRLVGAGNGLRENPLLAGLVAEAFGLPLSVPAHREEAAFGAALLAAVGGGVYPDLASAGRLIRYAAIE
jgi:sugar (pentulose or hexulose) kinase